ncbi:MAG: tRNA (N(6)-L-threonylcarbamoyladenosine(37)-C(2))-methylthiotransferase [Desulfurococcaceae archaeon]
MPMRVYIETYGCALNKSDESLMRVTLAHRGHKIADTLEEADVVVLNTCTVRLDTEYRVLSRIKELSKVCREANKKLIVAGCMAKAQPYTVSTVAPEASLVSPQDAHMIYIAVENPGRVLLLSGRRKRDLIAICAGSSVVPVPIQEGCLGNCSFCIVKHARRELVSHSVEAVVSAVKRAVEGGGVEVELTGMDLGVYGVDIYGKPALPALLREIESNVKGKYMIRVGMINPEYLKFMLGDLVEAVRESSRVFKFFHIPLQSGSERVLKLMGRRYTVDEYIGYVREIKGKIPDVSIATDIIVGHPGESEEDFEETIKVIQELEFERVHLAGYTIRPLTLSASMPQLDTKVKRERVKRALEVIVDLGLRIRRKYLQSTVKGFVTERTSTWVARLPNYIPVIVKDNTALEYGSWVNVLIDEITFYDIRGHLV